MLPGDNPVACTIIRSQKRPLVRHFSLALQPAGDGQGRTGLPLCGQRGHAGAIDQSRLAALLGAEAPEIRRLPPCNTCLPIMYAMGHRRALVTVDGVT